MKLSSEKRNIPQHLHKICYIALLKFKGTIQGRDISIAFCPNDMENYISVHMDNQLLIHKSSVIENINSLDKK
jgi:hypothetical protein